jgi:hypothetical protein
MILSRVCVIRDGLWLVIGFIGHLQIVSTSNYSAIANSHTLQFITASAKSLQSTVFTSRCSSTASDGGRSPYSGFPNYPRASATSL